MNFSGSSIKDFKSRNIKTHDLRTNNLKNDNISQPPTISEEKANIHPCSSEVCKDGNCPGCKDGKINCSDNSCSPYCVGCKIDNNENYNSVIFILCIIMCLLLLAFTLYIFFTPKILYKNSMSY